MASRSQLLKEEKKDTAVRQDILLPLVPLATSALTSNNSISFQLMSDPTDNDSPKYKVTQRIIDGSEDVRTLIHWKKETAKVVTGLNLSNDNQYDQTITIAIPRICPARDSPLKRD